MKLQASPSNYNPWEVTQWFQHFFQLIVAILEVIFHECGKFIGYNFWMFSTSQNDETSTFISACERDRNFMELYPGCREVVKVWGCFSVPEILELKVLRAQAFYCGAPSSHLQCPLGLNYCLLNSTKCIFVQPCFF